MACAETAAAAFASALTKVRVASACCENTLKSFFRVAITSASELNRCRGSLPVLLIRCHLPVEFIYTLAKAKFETLGDGSKVWICGSKRGRHA